MRRKIIDGKLVCTKCGVEKVIDDFHVRLTEGALGRTSQCKTCRKTYTVAWRRKNRPKVNKVKRQSYYRNRNEILERRRIVSAKPEIRLSRRELTVKTEYKITIVEYNNLLEYQNYSCALCGLPPRTKSLGIDHDHSHDVFHNNCRACRECIRGLLCDTCNGRVLPILEKHPRLQSDFVKNYLDGRPFASPKSKTENSNTKEITNEESENVERPHALVA